MKPVKQTRTGERGNCYAACIATLLEIKLSEVPELDTEKPEDFWKTVRNWLESKGYALVHVGPSISRYLYNAYYIASGPSPRLNGILHACIYKGDEPVFDPAPDNLFFGGKEFTEIDLLVPIFSPPPTPEA